MELVPDNELLGSTYGINVIVIPQMLKSSFDSGLWYSHIH